MSDSFVPRVLSLPFYSLLAGSKTALPARYRLDNAATIMPPVHDSVSTSLFRLSFDLREPIDAAALKTALKRTGLRFPYFTVKLHRGAFWYYLVPHREPLEVEDDSESPCQDFDLNRRGTRLFRIRTRGNRIAGEFSHIIADGMGGLRFMKTLLAEYCRLTGTEAIGVHPDVYRLGETPSPEEYEDAYDRHARPGLPAPELGRKAFRIQDKLLPKGSYRVTVGRFPISAVKAVAKSFGATLTELFSAIYLEALQEIWLATPPELRDRDTIAVEIPVDMRRYYPTGTNRNFALFVMASEDMRLGPRSFESLVERIKLQFRLGNDERAFARFISRNVAGIHNPIVRAVPLPIKDFFARILYQSLGEAYVSGVVTNLCAIDLPSGLDERVARFDIVQPPAASTKANLAIHSFRDELYVTVGSLARSKDLEKLVFSRLERLGLEAAMECNLAD